MRMKWKFALAGLTAFVFVGTASAEDITLRVGTMVPATSQQGVAVKKFAAALKLVGLNVQIFPASQLGNGPVQGQNVKLGIQDGFIEDLTWFTPFSDALKVANIPFLFRDRDHFENWVKSPAFNPIKKELEENGNQILYLGDTLWRRGPYRVMIAKQPVTNMDELSKIRLRLFASDVIMRYWGKDGFGANTVEIAWSEVYLALSQGTVDAVTGPLDQVVAMRFGEVAKHLVRTDEFPQVMGLSINKQKWESLSKEQQDAVHKAWNEAGAAFNAEVESEVDKWNEQLESQAVVFHEFDRPAFVKRSNEVTDELVKEGVWNAETIKNIQSAN